MINPTMADVGRSVIYTGNTYPGGKPEEGVITSFNVSTIFVRYAGKLHAQGTSPSDLEWSHPRAGDRLLITARYVIMRPEQPHESGSIEWPAEPGYELIRDLIKPLLDGADLEHVSVLADFAGGLKFKPADMFVDDMGAMKRLPVNGDATAIYRRNWLLQHPGTDPESLPAIYGPAILFQRRVWF